MCYMLSLRPNMETLFAHTYLHLFGKFAVGGLLAMAVPPFAEMERGFYKSTGAVWLVTAFIMSGGETSLFLADDDQGVVGLGGLLAWWLFTGIFSVYYLTLYVDWPLLRARSFPLAVFTGLIAVAITAAGYRPVSAMVLAGIPYATASATGACVVGGAATGMLLGHWYLIDTGLDLAPLKRMLAFFRYAFVIHVVTVLAGLAILALWPGGPLSEGFAAATGDRFVWLTLGRISAWGLTALLIFLIKRTLDIPQTMAATGLLYIAALVVAVGEIISHWLLFRTGLPI